MRDSAPKLPGNKRIGNNGFGSFAQGIGLIVLTAAMVAALLLLTSQLVGL